MLSQLQFFTLLLLVSPSFLYSYSYSYSFLRNSYRIQSNHLHNDNHQMLRLHDKRIFKILSSTIISNTKVSSTKSSISLSPSLSPSSTSFGTLALVGAGPGDPDLLTLQAINYIKNATLIISDRLISKEILQYITTITVPSCEIRIANKRPGCAEEAQDEIYNWVIEGVKNGLNVVRLKIGDPFLFGRGGEEVIEFQKVLNISCKVIPGISSSYAAPLVAGIPLTHRGISNQVLISTGYGRNSSIIDIPEYEIDRTIVLLMAVGRIEEIASNMTVNKHFPIDTPVAIVEKASTPQQRVITGTLQNIALTAKYYAAKAPATIIIGDVVNVLSSSLPSTSLSLPSSYSERDIDNNNGDGDFFYNKYIDRDSDERNKI